MITPCCNSEIILPAGENRPVCYKYKKEIKIIPVYIKDGETICKLITAENIKNETKN